MKKMLNGLITFLSLAITASPIRAIAQDEHKERIIAAWGRAKAYTKEYLEAATQEVYDFRPTPEIRSFAEQMQHLAVENYILVREASSQVTTISNYKDLEKIQLKTKEEVSLAVLESYDFAIATIKSISSSKWNTIVKMFGKRETTVEDGLDKSFEHQTHHRGQCAIYLRLNGITPPKEKLF
jgi:uncharacterized damage-inducible protein DinB